MSIERKGKHYVPSVGLNMNSKEQRCNDRLDVMAYFFEKYEKANFSVVPGHWPDFKTKEEVDEYMDANEKIIEVFRKL